MTGTDLLGRWQVNATEAIATLPRDAARMPAVEILLADPTLGMLLVIGRDDVTVEVALRGITTPLAVAEWRRLPAKVRQALPTAEDLTATMTRTVREIESTTSAA